MWCFHKAKKIYCIRHANVQETYSLDIADGTHFKRMRPAIFRAIAELHKMEIHLKVYVYIHALYTLILGRALSTAETPTRMKRDTQDLV